MIKVVCIFNKDGSNKTIPCLTIGKTYDAEEGKPTSFGFGIEDCPNGFIHAYRPLMDMKNWQNTQEYCDAYVIEHKEVLDIKNSYYWLTADNHDYSYNYDKKFFIPLAEWREQQINSILND
jgi:hypothetical protein